MSVAEQLVGGNAPSAVAQSPELFVINRDNEMTPEQQPLLNRYPDLSFSIAKEEMLGNGLLDPTTDSQTRSLLKALRESGVEELESGRRWDLSHDDVAPTYPERKKHLDRIKAFFSTEVSVHHSFVEDTEPDQELKSKIVYNRHATIRLKRNDVVDRKAALDTVMGQLEAVNHPVYQVLKYVRDTYGEKIEALPLTESILQLTMWNLLRDTYNDQVAAAKVPKPVSTTEEENKDPSAAN